MASTRKVLTTFSLVLITITCVDSIRNLPTAALFGPQVIFFYILAAIFYFIPTGLVCAELSTAWPETGGVYLWGKKAFGKSFGLFTVWFQWVENVIWYPTLLSFIAGTLAFLLTPKMAQNHWYVFAVINIVFWLSTLINLFGLKLSARLTEVLGIVGLVVPMLLIILLGVIWFFGHGVHQIHFSEASMLPNFKDPTLWVSVSAVVLSLTGIEITTVHAGDVKNPQKSYPRALLISVIFILLTLILGALSIAIVVPKGQLNLISGIMEAFHMFFAAYHLTFLQPLIAICLILGAIAALNNWIIGPTRGLMVAAKDGYFPPFLQKQNAFMAPRNLLLCQGVVVTLLSSLFLFMPSVNSSYWVLNVLTTQLYTLMYLCVFFMFLKLRFKYPKHKRPFKVPGGTFGMWLVSSFGVVSLICTLGIGFIPPTMIYHGSTLEYDALIFFGLVIFCLPPILMEVVSNPTWKTKG